MQQLLVLVQQGLALGGVGNQQRGPGLELHGGGKPPATRANDPELFHAVSSVEVCELLAFAVIFRFLPQNLSEIAVDSANYCIVSFIFNQDQSKMKCKIK